jgi:AraC-like DNA-binding protein
MNLEITQEGKGEIEIFQYIPPDIKNFLIRSANPLAIRGEKFKALFQEFKGEGFSAWYSRYWMDSPVVLKARGGIPILELRITLRNIIRGKWEKIINPELPVYHFQMGFVPYVVTRAIFEGKEYETFDIHFELSFLQEIGIDYKTLARFLNLVYKEKPAELSKYSHPCSNIMIEAVNGILYNSYSPAGKAHLLRNNVTNILIAALEEVGKEEIENLPLSPADIEALHHVRELIEEYCPVYLGNDELIKKVKGVLNAFKLSFGFKRLFGVGPYEYYLERRFILAKDLLRKGNKVITVANELEYESDTAFIKAFRKRFRLTPKQFQLHAD